MISGSGFDFDGRIAEDFKLASGTWVSVGPLRARFIAACAPLVRDVVIAGINRDEVSALVVLDLDGCRLINPALPSDDLAAIAARCPDPRRVSRAVHQISGCLDGIVDADHPRGAARYADVDRSRRSHRQGSINQRAVLEHRSRLIDELYSPAPAVDVITPS
jgi:feruloyl-CoA synthase